MNDDDADQDDLFPITLADQLRCVEREIELRDRVYPRWIASGKLSQKKADHECAAMRAVAKSIRCLMAQDLST